MQFKYVADRVRYRSMSNTELRDSFVVSDLFELDRIPLTYSEIDRGVIGSAVPRNGQLALPAPSGLSAEFMLQNRELGVVNVGAAGRVTCDGASFDLDRLDSLYVARGTRDVTFESKDPDQPAKFYMVSYPAHATFKTMKVAKTEAKSFTVGGPEKCNQRTIFQSIRPGIVETCQIVMGFTQVAEGSVWNTFPPHTHGRRSEYYMYFDLDASAIVVHLMGEPDNVRTLFMKDGEAALSPMWSMHSGVGSSHYSFVWTMGGENQEFDDMDHIVPTSLR